MRPDQWTPEQKHHRQLLLALLPARSMWVKVCPPKKPQGCSGGHDEMAVRAGLAKQRERLAAAEARLSKKFTVTADREAKVATKAAAAFMKKLRIIESPKLREKPNGRIWPKTYAPAEVAETGHDRCIVPLKPDNLLAWLSPEGRRSDDLHALLEDRWRPYYEHRLAA